MAETKGKAAKEKTEASEAVESTQPEATPEPAEREEQAVERERLISSSYDFFGHSPHVVAGTLEGMDGRKNEFLPSEVEAEIDNFLKRPVKEG
jgi:hypothetical protein